MSEKLSMADGFKDGIVLVVSAVGLSLEPHVFVACIILSLVGAVVGRGFTPVMAQRKTFILTLGAGLLSTIVALLLNQSAAGWAEWWPHLPPQLIAAIGGAFGPLTIAFLMKKFPVIAERVLGRVLPDEKTG